MVNNLKMDSYIKAHFKNWDRIQITVFVFFLTSKNISNELFVRGSQSQTVSNILIFRLL